jgi:hypothetical protein
MSLKARSTRQTTVEIDMQSEFPRLKALLLEDEGEDVVSGLRKALGLIQSGWSSDYTGVKKEQERLWKKLPPAQQQNVKSLFMLVIEKLFRTPNSTINTDLIKATDRSEASAIVATMQKFATGAREVDGRFLSNQEYLDNISADDVALFKSQYDGAGPADIRLGAVTIKFLTDHADQVKQIIGMYDDTLGFNVDEVVRRLDKAIAATPEEKRKEAIRGLHYFLLDIAHEFEAAKQRLVTKFSPLNKQPPEAKPEGEESTK